MLTQVEAGAARKAYGLFVLNGYPPGLARKKAAQAIILARRRVTGRMDVGMGDQAFFDQLTKVQNRVVAIQAELAAIGSAAWDGAVLNNRGKVEAGGWIPAENYKHRNMMEFWAPQFSRLIATSRHLPSQTDISDVTYLATGTDKLIALVRSLLPAAQAAAAQAERREMEAKLQAMGPLKSPADAARKSLMDELSGKFTLFSAAGIGIGVAALVAASMFMAGKRG